MPREVLTESVENSGGAKDAKEIKEADWIHPLSIEDMDLKKALKLTRRWRGGCNRIGAGAKSRHCSHGRL